MDETVSVKIAGETFRVPQLVGSPYYLEHWKMWESGQLEPALFNFIREFAGPDTTFFDLGAWIGCATLPASKLYKSVYSFEAEPFSYSILQQNLELNTCSNVIPIMKFVGDEVGITTMYAPGDMGVSNSSAFFPSGKHSWKAETMRIDPLLETVLKKGPVVMKIDIEGAEYTVIPTIQRLARHKNLRAVCLSLHPFAILNSVEGTTLLAKLRRRAKLLKSTLGIMGLIMSFTKCRNANGQHISRISLLLSTLYHGNTNASEREIFLSKP